MVPHLAALKAGFTYDDRDFVTNNASIRSVPSALSAFVRPFPLDQPERGLFRPVTNLSYAFDRALLGLTPFGFHLTNLLLYAGICLLVLVVARRLMPEGAFFATVFFAIHPVHCEVVDSVAGRSELLSLGFTLLALIALHGKSAPGSEARLHPASVIAVAAAATCAMLAKESGLIAVPLVAAYIVFVFRPKTRSLLHLIPLGLLLIACMAAYFALRFAALSRMTPAHSVLADQGSILRMLSIGAIFFKYLQLLVAPVILDVDFYYQYAVGIAQSNSLPSTLGLAMLALGAALLVTRIRAMQRGSALAAAQAFALTTFFVALMPTSHLIPFGSLMAERFLFAPSLGAALLVGTLAGRLTSRRSHVVFGLIGMLLATRSAVRACDWEDEVTLFSVTAARIPPDPRVDTNLAMGYIARGDGDAAIPLLQRALKVAPRHLAALNNLGYLQMSRGDLTGARASFERVLAIEPANASAYNNLGVIAVKQTKYPLARGLYLRALERNPNYDTARTNLASVEQALAAAGAYAREHGSDRTQSRDPMLLLTLARACLVTGDLECARDCYARAGANAPDPAMVKDSALEEILR